MYILQNKTWLLYPKKLYTNDSQNSTPFLLNIVKKFNFCRYICIYAILILNIQIITYIF